MQNQGNPENMYYMYPTNNKDIQEAFANIVNDKWAIKTQKNFMFRICLFTILNYIKEPA